MSNIFLRIWNSNERQAKGYGLTRPELAVTLAYAKLTLFDDLIASDVPDDQYLSQELIRYFPRAVPERFPDAVRNPSPAARDHRNPSWQFDHQPRRTGFRGPHHGRDECECRADRKGLRGCARQLTR